jgi:hypothetical protein
MGEATGGAGGTAGAASIASLGLSAFSSITKAEGTHAADEMQADRAQRAADFGRLQANLTDASMRENLNVTLGNIDVIRAAGHIDPSSPTTAAVEDYNRMVGERARTAAELSIRSQVAEDEAGASYLRKAGDFALSQGYLDAGVKIAGGLAKAATVG